MGLLAAGATVVEALVYSSCYPPFSLRVADSCRACYSTLGIVCVTKERQIRCCNGRDHR
jgi:hypothetical protein